MSAQEKNFASRTLALLRQGPFRRYIIGSAISDTGTWMQVMAQGWQVCESRHWISGCCFVIANHFRRGW